MPTVRGRNQVDRYFAAGPDRIRKALRGAGRVAVKVIATEAKARCISSEVQAAIKTAVGEKDGRIVARVLVKGEGAYIAPWLEYGTSPHFITIDDSQRGGMSVGRINRTSNVEGSRGHSLIINGKFVGSTVLHPGARPHPFMRPALDTKQAEALQAAQAHVVTQLKSGRAAGAEDDSDV